MKILKLRFKNINSFYGEHPPLDFTVPPLSETGLFIITGQPGAGKSTLLDVITLALYNKVPRFDRSMSQNEIDKLGSVVNLKAADEPRTEAYAEVEYEVKSGRFRSRWSISKNRNGNWNNYHMEIAELPSGQLLDIKRLSDFPDKNAELIGLRYEQFVKSIILAQGSFAEFLRADRNTRGKLLEDITGTYIYRTIGIAAFQKEKEWSEKLKMKEAEMLGVQLLDAEAISKIQDRLAESQTEKDAAEKSLMLWESEKRYALEVEDLNRRLEVCLTQKREISQQIQAFAVQEHRMLQHESIGEYIAELTILKENKVRYKALQNAVNDIERRSQEVQKETARLLDEAQRLTSKPLTPETLPAALTAFEKEVLGLENRVNALKAEANPLRTAIRNEIQSSKTDFFRDIAMDDSEGALTRLSMGLQQQRDILKIYPENFDPGVRLTALNVVDRTVVELKNAMARRLLLAEEGKSKKSSLDAAKKIAEDGQPRLDKLKLALTKLSEEITLLKEKRDIERSKSELKDLRRELKEGEPCPLCGAVHHPYVHEYANNLLGLHEEILVNEEKWTALSNEDRQLSAQILSATTTTEAFQLELNRLRLLYKESDMHIKALVQQAGWEEALTTEALEKEQRSVQIEREEISRWEKARVTHEVILRLTSHFNALNLISREEKVASDQYRSIFKGSDIQSVVRRMLRQWQDCKNGEKQVEKERTENSELLKNSGSQIETLTATLVSKLAQRGIHTIEDAESRILSAEDYQALKASKKRIDDSMQECVLRERAFLQDLEVKNSSRTMREASIEVLTTETNRYRSLHQTLVGETATLTERLGSNAENQKRFASLQQEIEQLRLQKYKWELLKKYIGDAGGNNFSNFAQSLTLNNLIWLANLRLNNLSDRYILDKPRNDADHLFVLDTFQGNAPRSVTTLSGGESFTISLALALALSDLASRNVRIESLFIDEGFGTLDPESLESALLTLERLQAESQKTVGVISHRHEMKDRIPVQVQIEKGVDGNSKVVVVG